MNPKTIRGFAAIYALLFLLVVGSIAGGWAAYKVPQVEHQVSAVKQQLGDTNLTRLADKAIASAAQSQGLAVTKITVLHTDVKGDDAVVTARVTVTDGISSQTVTLKVSFSRSVWSVQGMTAA